MKKVVTVDKNRAEMIMDILKTLMISDDINIKSLYKRFFVVIDVEIMGKELFRVTGPE